MRTVRIRLPVRGDVYKQVTKRQEKVFNIDGDVIVKSRVADRRIACEMLIDGCGIWASEMSILCEANASAEMQENNVARRRASTPGYDGRLSGSTQLRMKNNQQISSDSNRGRCRSSIPLLQDNRSPMVGVKTFSTHTCSSIIRKSVNRLDKKQQRSQHLQFEQLARNSNS